MKAKYINPFIEASMNLFKNHMGVEVQNDKPFINPEAQNLNEISAIIGLAGETVGAVVLSFGRDTAVHMVSRFAGKQYQALSRDVIDGVGELVNILAGNAKKGLKDYRIEISLPGVVTGKQYKINWPQGIPVITIPYKSSLGNFSINVSLRDES